MSKNKKKIQVLAFAFRWLHAKELSAVSIVNHRWNRLTTSSCIWEAALKDPNIIKKSELALLAAVRSNNPILVQRYCEIGFLTQFIIDQGVKKKGNFCYSVSGFFPKPTLLCVAANSVTGKNGVKIITALLKHGANAEIKSEFHGVSQTAPDDFGGGGHVFNVDRNDTPAEYARGSVKAILLLAELEIAIKENKPLNMINTLKFHDDQVEVKKYIMRLMQSDQSFKGLQHELTAAELAKIKEIPELMDWYSEMIKPSQCCAM